MKRMITVAAVQMEIAPLDTVRNLAKIEKLVGELCNQQPVDLVVLPEDVLTGPIPYNLERLERIVWRSYASMPDSA